MIKQIMRLVRPGLFLPCFAIDVPDEKSLCIRPRWLSICAADQRYFQGDRPPEVLRKKLPIALFHEALGEVLSDPSGRLAKGTLCVLLPGGPGSAEDGGNYRQGAFFRSSNADGFCQEFLQMRREEVIPLPKRAGWIYVFSELMSVACQALRRLPPETLNRENLRAGVWGDGSMAFMTALAISKLKPSWETVVFGKHDAKLLNFSFASECVNVADTRNDARVDAAFECVGGQGAQQAISQIVARIVPKGAAVLMGVSETPPMVPTRMILEKGLTFIGTSRSTAADFETAVKLIGMPDVQNTLLKIVSARETVASASELIDAFRRDRKADYKTVIQCAF